MGFETEKWPYVPARWQTPVQGRREVRVVVVHAMEAQEKPNTAENVAEYFRTHPGYVIVGNRKITSKPSAHLCVDSDSIIQCVLDNNVAHAAPGVNRDGIHIEHAGYAKQSRLDWLDPYGVLMLNLSANAAAQYCLKYGIPIVHLTDEQLRAGQKGLIGHVQATHVYKPNAGHQDPGPDFPWDFYLERVTSFRDKLAA